MPMQDTERIDARRCRHVKVAVAILTCKRLDLLGDYLAKAALLRHPDKADLVFLVIDNDPAGSARSLVEENRLHAPTYYVHEPVRGIPVARNRAMEEARRLGADLLCFIDDDEVPDAEWVEQLVLSWRHSGAHLIGGPVDVCPARPSASFRQRLVTASLAARMRRKNKKTEQVASSGGRFTIVTNNWLGDLAFFAEKGIRFDETLLVTGGSDTKFHADAVRHGARTAWAANARVQETITPERQSFYYQLKRGAMQSIQNFRLKGRPSTKRVATTAVLVPIRLLTGVLLLLIPIYGIASIVIALRSIGWSFGRVAAIFGAQSSLYSEKPAAALSIRRLGLS